MTMALEGELDSTNYHELEEALGASLKGVKELVFDFAKLDYISSAGLRVLLTARKAMEKQGEMIVINANENVLDIFDVTGFRFVLDIR